MSSILFDKYIAYHDLGDDMIYVDSDNVKISGYDGIGDVSAGLISIKCGNKKVIVLGEHLQLVMMSVEELRIKGIITTVSFDEKI